MDNHTLVQDAISYIDKAKFRLEMIEDMLSDLDKIRLVGEIRGAHRILSGVAISLREGGDN